MAAIKAMTVFLLLIGAAAVMCSSAARRSHDEDGDSAEDQRPAAVVQEVTRFRPSYEDKLYTFLFDRYNRDVRPCADVKCSRPLQLQFGASIVNAELHFSEKRMSLHSWLRLMWDDPRLTWDPQDYGGVESIRVPQDVVWTPDMVLYTKDQIQGNVDKEWNEDVQVVVSSSGNIILVPPSYLRVPCQFDQRASQQQCSLKFGSWTYNGLQISLSEFGGRACDLADFYYVIHDGWTLDGCDAEVKSIHYGCCPEPYESMHFNVTFKQA